MTRDMVWSFTRLDLYERCPGAWKRRYIDHEKGTSRLEAMKGILCHRIAEAYWGLCNDAGVASDPNAMPDLVNSAFFGSGGCGLPQSEYQDVAHICFRIADRMCLELDDYYGTERNFTADVGGYKFQARLDLVHVRGTVATNTDLKTGFGVKSQAATDADFQLSTQAVMVFANIPHTELVESNLYYPRFNVLRESTRTFEDVERTRDEIVLRIQQIEADDEFRFTPGDGCAWCEFKGDCVPLADAIAAVGNLLPPVTDDVGALAALERMVLLAVALEDTKAKLKPWAKLTGPVASAGMEYGERDATRTIYPPRAIMAAFEGTEVDVFDLMTVGAKKLASAVRRESEDVADAVEAAKIVKPGVKCDLHKTKGASDARQTATG